MTNKVKIKRLDSVTANDTAATLLINENFQAIQTAIENTLSRDGTTPNFMDTNLDLNSYKIINCGEATDDKDVVTLKYVKDAIGNAAEDAANAAASAAQAASSAQSALVSSANAAAAVRNAETTITQATNLLNETQSYVDDAKVEIDAAVTQGKVDINQYVTDAEEEVKQIARDEANKAIANATAEATQEAKDNVNQYVDDIIEPSLQTYVDQAEASKVAAKTSETNAKASENSASASASAAKTSETNAKVSETSAAQSASEAAQSAASINPSRFQIISNLSQAIDESTEKYPSNKAVKDAISDKKLLAYENMRIVECSGSVTITLQNTDEAIGLSIIKDTTVFFDVSALTFPKNVYTVQIYFRFPNGAKTISLSSTPSIRWLNNIVPNFSLAGPHWLVLRFLPNDTFVLLSDAGEVTL